MGKYKLFSAVSIFTTLAAGHALAQNHEMCMDEKKDLHVDHHSHHKHTGHGVSHYAPAGVMGDHMHPKGEWMLSYGYMRMDMDGSRNGNSALSVSDVLAQPNRFAAMPGQPASLRIIPKDMTMQMHMLGAMYAPTEWMTLMLMANYIENQMNHVTYNGAGNAIVGNFTTESRGWGDTSLSSLIRVYEKNGHHIHLNAGVSLPTGSIDEEANVLAPNGSTPRLRMPYAMQLGTGTFDALPGVTYTGASRKWGWGAQYMARIPLENRNAEGYKWGDKHTITAWGSYAWKEWIATSARVVASTQDKIDGIDANIMGPVQTADPDNYGGEKIEIGLGMNLLGTNARFKEHRLSMEFIIPVYRNLNGPQLETDHTFMLSWKKSF